MLERMNLDSEVYDALQGMILSGALPPGKKINQEAVAGKLGVSRTPVINALKRLEQDQLVVAVPRRGFFVRELSPQELVPIFELREVLEGLMARRAVQEASGAAIERLAACFDRAELSYAAADRLFHTTLLEIAGGAVYEHYLKISHVLVFSFLIVENGGLVRPEAETRAEHAEILEALRQRDGEAAEALMKRHLQRSRAVIEQWVAEQGEMR